ncbi:MAG: DUF2079 domain-containing protein, partial [Anaerolineae bacterium]|nr:DUF2079 domain-containing protein [Anaerolineae bacterium]
MQTALPLGLLAWVLVAGLAIRIEGIRQTDQTSFTGQPLIDDAYFYAALGRNLADGHGPRVDAEHYTTGFQPLWGFLSALPYLLLPDEHGITALQAMGVAVGALTCLVIYGLAIRMTDSRWLALIPAGLWFVAPHSMLHNLGGMETALAILAQMLMFLSLYRLYETGTRRWWVLHGLACGFGFLARVDSAVLVAAMGALLALFPPGEGRPLRERARRLATWGGVVLMVALPWLIFTTAWGKPPPARERRGGAYAGQVHWLSGGARADPASLSGARPHLCGLLREQFLLVPERLYHAALELGCRRAARPDLARPHPSG